MHILVGNDLVRPGQALDRARRTGGADGGAVLHYRVPKSVFDELSGRTFYVGDTAIADFLRSIRAGNRHTFDYVEGPYLKNPRAFYAGKEAAVLEGNQVSFHTQRAVELLNGYLQS